MLQGSVYQRFNSEKEIKSTRNDAFRMKVQVEFLFTGSDGLFLEIKPIDGLIV